jgi:hypothetical protein
VPVLPINGVNGGAENVSMLIDLVDLCGIKHSPWASRPFWEIPREHSSHSPMTPAPRSLVSRLLTAAADLQV